MPLHYLWPYNMQLSSYDKGLPHYDQLINVCDYCCGLLDDLHLRYEPIFCHGDLHYRNLVYNKNCGE